MFSFSSWSQQRDMMILSSSLLAARSINWNALNKIDVNTYWNTFLLNDIVLMEGTLFSNT